MPQLIDEASDWNSALATLEAAPVLALDTESDSFFAYEPRICLLQVSIPGHDLLIDPMADLDLSGLGRLLADPGREIVLHAAENDVIQMRHQFDWQIANLFDTQVVCFILGLPPYSLAGVLEARFGVKLNKKQQRSDWSRRPLTEDQTRYAAEDTHHLLDLRDELKERMEQAGRIEEVRSECRRISERTWEPEPFDPEGFRRMNGAKQLDGVGLRILQGVFLLRNAEAERRNRAPYRVTSDQTLVTIARTRATGPGKGIAPSFWSRYGKRVAGIVRKAANQGPLPPPERRRTRGETQPPAVKARYDALRKWRTRAAEERGVESFVVARNELLMEVAKRGGDRVEAFADLMEPFRAREYGEAVLRAMLDSTPRPPENAGSESK